VSPIPLETDKVLTVSEISQLLRVDRHTVTDLFAHERDVIVLGNPETKRGQRRYRQFRIPQSVFNRVVSRMRVKQ
jgi:hypothetical protein